jgi:hypothetical protein
MSPTAVPQQYAEPGLQPLEEARNVLNPSPSPLGVNAADLAGLTPENVSQALTGAIGAEELRRRSIADVAERVYTRAATERLRAQTEALTPRITVPGTDIVLTESAFIDWYKAATKDERSAAVKNYEYARGQGYKGSFQQWTTELAEASGKSIAEVIAQVTAVETVKDRLKVEKHDYFTDIEERLRKDEELNYNPPGWKEFEPTLGREGAKDRARKLWALREADKEIRAAHKGREVVRKPDGWYVDGKLVVRNPYYAE